MKAPSVANLNLGSFSQAPVSKCRAAKDSATARKDTSASVYVVDDEQDLTELYSLVLSEAGYKVQAFNHRSKALAALTAEVKKPDLLVTDYFGLSMHVHDFMNACRVVHPRLRILMASGFSQRGVPVSCARARPDHFICKPFTPEEFLNEVKVTLVMEIPRPDSTKALTNANCEQER